MEQLSTELSQRVKRDESEGGFTSLSLLGLAALLAAAAPAPAAAQSRACG